MPRFDGTGPRGDGPMTGRGEGFCVLELRGPDRPARGYAGLEGAGVHIQGMPARYAWPAAWRVHAFGRRGGWAARRALRRWLPWR
jgi:hypothetical protein